MSQCQVKTVTTEQVKLLRDAVRDVSVKNYLINLNYIWLATHHFKKKYYKIRQHGHLPFLGILTLSVSGIYLTNKHENILQDAKSNARPTQQLNSRRIKLYRPHKRDL